MILILLKYSTQSVMKKNTKTIFKKKTRDRDEKFNS